MLLSFVAFACGLILIGCGNDNNQPIVVTHPTVFITAGTGATGPTGPSGPGGTGPTGATGAPAPSPSPSTREFLVTENASGEAITTYLIDPNTGAPTVVSPDVPLPAPSITPFQTAVSTNVLTSGNVFAYVVNGSSAVVSGGSEAATGQAVSNQVIQTASFNPAFTGTLDPSGKFYYIATQGSLGLSLAAHAAQPAANNDIEMLPVQADGSLGQPVIQSNIDLSTDRVDYLNAVTVGSTEFVVLTLGSGTVEVATIGADGTLATPSGNQIATIDFTPFAAATATTGSTVSLYVGGTGGNIVSFSIDASGNLTSTSSDHDFSNPNNNGNVAGGGAAVDSLAVGQFASGDVLYAGFDYNANDGNQEGIIGAFAIGSDGTLSTTPLAPTPATDSGYVDLTPSLYERSGNNVITDTYFPIALAVDPQNKFLFTGITLLPNANSDLSLFVYTLGPNGSIGNIQYAGDPNGGVGYAAFGLPTPVGTQSTSFNSPADAGIGSIAVFQVTH